MKPGSTTIHQALPRTDDITSPPRWFNTGVRLLVRGILQRKYDIDVHGAEKLPKAGPVLLAQNHLNEVDGPLVAAMAPRRMHALTKIEVFHGPIGFAIKLFGQIPLDRTNVDVGAIRLAVRALRDDHVVGIYPEGRRGSGDFSEASGGLAYLALVTGAPIVPLALLGTRQPGGPIDSFPPNGSTIDLVFGDPIRVQAIPYPRRQQTVRDLTEQLRLQLRDHVLGAVELTGNQLPGPPPEPDNSQMSGA